MTTIALSRSRYISLILILGTLTALGPFSIDMYLPGFPAIAKDLGVDQARVALSLSSFFVGISAGQLLYGPLLDRFGRKIPLYIGLVLYIVASAGCMYATTLNSLIILRFVQAIGSCAAAVASVAMVRDLFPVKDNAKVFALLMLVVGTSPMIAPTVGSYVTSVFSWHTVFLILGVMGILILLATILWLPESYHPDTTMSLKPRPIITNFLSVVSEPQFYTYAFAGAISFSGLFAYVSGSPQIFMDVYKLSDTTYGWIFAFLSIGLIGSSQVNSWLLKHFTSQQIVPIAMAGQVIVCLILIVGAWNNWLSLAGIITLLFAFLCCLGCINPNTSALSLAPFTKNAGSASALMGAIQMGLGALASAVVSLFDTHSAMPLAVTMFGSSLLALLVLLMGRKQIKTAITTPDKASAVIVH
ncbi:multidrug effflux MFS transporter [Chitinophaga nivalis]|uniref:Multidrug effflux MFS transporter n=1 Tax=Chitinophaga nivalis TaxID=2991709 RepID=A0ABT3IHV4_9BACT|nr:multidrug effflux MFS transporter [Chitinophaga nivalis]MCW3466772.1 multidrug effflux MFS transporter [Chitinophaga nivalis]MCW3483537.1 multidrug effflux MFS transporter [Chitinophaga nivalis]